MKIRKLQPEDVEEVWQLFYDTVHHVNIKDYSKEQLAAWAPRTPLPDKWRLSLLDNIAYVATIEDKIVGFCDMTKDGYLDRLFSHKDFQNKGIASVLLRHIEDDARKHGIDKIWTEASVTAKPFFEARGFKVVKEQTKVLRNMNFINFVMQKKL